ncbi:beta-lactamase-like protein [Lipomyces oligophaga]|uniref:beta-lactamase-like protein n=1 Tax=Lipomyces oligophaga TaxID=45792 RepID=UPI0034CF1924
MVDISITQQSSCYTFEQLNHSTYKVVQHDSFNDLPFIYVKVYETVLVLVDTGSGPNYCRNPTVQSKNIRPFIEAHLAKNGQLAYSDPEGKTLNKKWLVFITHSHYDHIGGITEFTDDSEIYVSGNDKDYVLHDLGCHSLCCAIGMETPKFEVTHWLQHNERLSYNGVDLGLEALLTPGHTPDEIALYDINEHVLFTGDSLYETIPIYIIDTSDMVEYIKSMEFLLEYIKAKNTELTSLGIRVTTAAGHVTDTADTEILLQEAIDCYWDTLNGKSTLTERIYMRKLNVGIYMNAKRNVGFLCIDEKLEAAIKHFKTNWELPPKPDPETAPSLPSYAVLTD